MSTDEYIDIIISNLKVIGMVPKGGKLCIRKGHLCLDAKKPTRFHPLLQPITRWFNGDSRDLTLLHTKNTINGAVKISKTMMRDNSTDLWTLQRIMEELMACETGIQNLKATYSYDSMMLANLDVILERQKANCEEIQVYISRDENRKKKEKN